MPIYTVSAKSSSETQCTTTLQKTSSQNTPTRGKVPAQQPRSQVSGEEKDSVLSLSQNRTLEVNRTYVISACRRLGDDTSSAFKPEGRLTLQRRTGASKKPASSGDQLHTNTMQGVETLQMEKRLTLQRRVRTGSVDKSKINQNTVYGIENKDPAQTNYKMALPPNINDNDTHDVKPSFTLAEGQSSTKLQCNLNSKDSFGAVDGLCQSDSCVRLKHRMGTADTGCQNEVPRAELLVTSSDINRVSGEQLNGKGSISKLSGKQRLQHLIMKHNSLERPRTPAKGSAEGFTPAPKNSTSQDQPSLSASNKRISRLQILAQRKTSVPSSPSVGRSSKPKESTETLAESSSSERDVFKVETSKVIVAVRVRPFSNRFV